MSDQDSDEELREILALRGPGVYREEAAPKQKSPYDKAGLDLALANLCKSHQKFPWAERLDITCSAENSQDAIDIADDFAREAYFLAQAEDAALIGLKKLNASNIPIQRPPDYFAEMAKSDRHMQKIRETLVSKQRSIELRDKARSLREARKFGKKVQREAKVAKQTERREFLQAVKSYKKGKMDSGQLDQLLDNKGKSAAELNQSLKEKNSKKGLTGAKKKAAFKNKKFGFGGQKKRSKYNTKSSADSFAKDFNTAKHGAVPSKAKRLNKARGNKGRKR